MVLKRSDTDATMKGNDPRLSGAVVMIDSSGSVILWFGTADTKERNFLDLHRGGEKVLAEKLAGRL